MIFNILLLFLYQRVFAFFIKDLPLNNILLFFEGSERIEVISIVLNNIRNVKLQIKFCKKFFEKNTFLTIIDNSVNKTFSNILFNLCKSENINYLKSIPQECNFPSRNHGHALNWAYYNYIINLKPSIFGIIDQDVFPIKSTNIAFIFRQGIDFYALKQTRKQKYWYLHSGFSFYRFNSIKDKKIDFMPKYPMDTAGGNYYTIYRYFSNKRINKTVRFCKFEQIRISKVFYSQIYDGLWFHCGSMTNWHGASKESMESKQDCIENYLLNKY